jgi:aryl-alcohol dehydrogenase-like predicted oxidoreductase
VNETIPALQKLKEAGKIRFLGITGLPLEIFTYVLDRVPPGTVDVILSYCHYSINDSTMEDLLPYLKSKGVGIITASPLAMGLLTESGPPSWHPASPELKVFFLNNQNFNFLCFFCNGYILLTNTMSVCVCADVCQPVMPKRRKKKFPKLANMVE